MNRNRVLLIGALLGAATGVVGAMLLYRRAEDEGKELSITTGDGVRLGVMIVGLLRAVAGLADEK
jgi:gas vesicle protein